MQRGAFILVDVTFVPVPASCFLIPPADLKEYVRSGVSPLEYPDRTGSLVSRRAKGPRVRPRAMLPPASSSLLFLTFA